MKRRKEHAYVYEGVQGRP